MPDACNRFLIDLLMSQPAASPARPHTPQPSSPQLPPLTPPPRRRRLPWKWLWLLLPLLGLAIWYWGFRQTAPEVKLLTTTVTRGNLEDSVLASGTLQARQLVNVGSQASGQVRRLYVRLGDTVQRGDLIAQIDSVTQQNSLRNAESSVANLQAQRAVSQANLELNQAQLGRYRALLRENAVSRSEYDSAASAVRVNRAQIAAFDAQIAQARNQINTASQNLGYTRITAPISGTVVAIVTEEGQTVNANQTAPTIVKLADLSTMTVEAQISEADVPRIRPGQPVYFTLLGDPDRRYEATLRAIEPASTTIKSESSSTSTSQAVYYNALFDVPNTDGTLRIDMTAQVYVVLKSATNVLQIPLTALRYRPRPADDADTEKSAERDSRDSSAGSASGRQASEQSGSGQSGSRRQDGNRRASPGNLTEGSQRTIYVPDDQQQPQPRQIVIGMNNRVNVEVRSGLTADERVIIGERRGNQPPASRSRGRAGGPGMP